MALTAPFLLTPRLQRCELLNPAPTLFSKHTKKLQKTPAALWEAGERARALLCIPTHGTICASLNSVPENLAFCTTPRATRRVRSVPSGKLNKSPKPLTRFKLLAFKLEHGPTLGKRTAATDQPGRLLQPAEATTSAKFWFIEPKRLVVLDSVRRKTQWVQAKQGRAETWTRTGFDAGSLHGDGCGSGGIKPRPA
eukprot:988180-Rhodomonas_salina.3